MANKKIGFEDNAYSFEWKVNPNQNNCIEFDIGLTKDNSKQETSFKIIENLTQENVLLCLNLSRNGISEKDSDLSFEPTTEITESMKEFVPSGNMEAKMIYVNMFTTVALINNLSEDVISFMQ